MGKKNGGPAFPHKLHWCEQLKDGGLDDYEHIFQGMSLRDWFAGQALASGNDGDMLRALTDAAKEEGVELADYMAHIHYNIADAMLKERDKE